MLIVNNIIKIGLGLAIAIVFPFMVAFGIEAFYSPPESAYEVCRLQDPAAKLDPERAQQIQARDPMLDENYKKCFDEAQQKVDIYNRNLFLITSAFGFAAITVGTLLFSEKLGPVGPGLVFGGLFTILYGTTRSFRSLDKRWLFLELLVIFVGLIFVTWRFLQVSRKK
jgi:hypothetical protein